jgi:hypothetical protein
MKSHVSDITMWNVTRAYNRPQWNVKILECNVGINAWSPHSTADVGLGLVRQLRGYDGSLLEHHAQPNLSGIAGARGARLRRMRNERCSRGRVCTITELGRGAFSDWITRMPGEEQIRFPLLLTMFFSDAVPPELLREACVVHRRVHAARLAGYEGHLAKARAEAPHPVLALEFGIAYERTVLAWIDGLPWMAPAS